jgi:hypothetical protein
MAIGRQFHWVNNERLVFDLEDREAPAADQIAAPDLFAVDHDGKRYRQLVERQMVWLKNGNATGQLEPWGYLSVERKKPTHRCGCIGLSAAAV